MTACRSCPTKRKSPDPINYVKLTGELSKRLKPRQLVPAVRALADCYAPGASASQVQSALEERYASASWLPALIELLPVIFALLAKLWG